MNWQWGVCHFIHHRVEIFYPFISCNGKRRGLVLTHKSFVSLPPPPPANLLLVCTCEMMGSSVWLRTQIYGIISWIMDIENISYYSFTVRNMTCINSHLCVHVWIARMEDAHACALDPRVCVWKCCITVRLGRRDEMPQVEVVCLYECVCVCVTKKRKWGKKRDNFTKWLCFIKWLFFLSM